MKDQQKQFFSVRQFAEAVGLAEVTIRTWLADRKVSFVKFGRAVRIPSTELARIIEEGSIPARRSR